MRKTAKYPFAEFINQLPDIEIVDGMVFVTVETASGVHTRCIPVSVYRQFTVRARRTLDDWDIAQQEHKVLPFKH